MCAYKICFIFIIQALLIQIMHYVHSLRFPSSARNHTYTSIRVYHDHYIILCCFCSHIIITDYYLPMSTPLILADHDRISLEFLL